MLCRRVAAAVNKLATHRVQVVFCHLGTLRVGRRRCSFSLRPDEAVGVPLLPELLLTLELFVQPLGCLLKEIPTSLLLGPVGDVVPAVICTLASG